MQFCIKLDPRDTVKPLTPSQKTTGIDVGLKFFLVDSEGHQIDCPNYYRKAEKQLNRLNRKKSKKYRKGKKQSRNYHKARQRYARKHLRVSRQREEFVKSVALRLVKSNDLIAYENLNIKGMVNASASLGVDPERSRRVKNRHLAKSITDAGWSVFRQWLEYFGDKYGKLTIAVSPHNTSQNCSNCGQKVQKSLSTRTHVCPHCGYTDCRDRNAALNILQKGLSSVGRTQTLNASGEIPSWLVGEILLANGDSMNEESPSL
ncbi:hypothetical protein MiTs_02533 [Microcystis aeruginosa NIES-2521]|uniref:C2H2-type domain-containing protein n=1 Tax=Microcystis aeruginosa NIES-2521 TaxID=2303983 RepID=A0A5A5RVL5_MICAE|nr:hypothetical protein MiTs_02533 [Microcystis aeruginosa NIES-2521]